MDVEALGLAQNDQHCCKGQTPKQSLVRRIDEILVSLPAHSLHFLSDPPQTAKACLKSSSLFLIWFLKVCPLLLLIFLIQRLPVTSWFAKHFHTCSLLALLAHELLVPSPFRTWRDWSSEKLSDLLEVTG